MKLLLELLALLSIVLGKQKDSNIHNQDRSSLTLSQGFMTKLFTLFPPQSLAWIIGTHTPSGQSKPYLTFVCLDKMPGTAILLHAPVVCPRARQQVRASRRNVLIRASQDTKEAYVPPSMRTSHTELDALKYSGSEVVPDVLLSQNLQDVEQPKAATSSRSVLGGILNSPGLRRYKVLTNTCHVRTIVLETTPKLS